MCHLIENELGGVHRDVADIFVEKVAYIIVNILVVMNLYREKCAGRMSSAVRFLSGWSITAGFRYKSVMIMPTIGGGGRHMSDSVARDEKRGGGGAAASGVMGRVHRVQYPDSVGQYLSVP